MCWVDGTFHAATHRPTLEIIDRVGNGDSIASGFIHGLMEFGDPAKAVEHGAAHGSLAMTTPGDTTKASLRKSRNWPAPAAPENAYPATTARPVA